VSAPAPEDKAVIRGLLQAFFTLAALNSVLGRAYDANNPAWAKNARDLSVAVGEGALKEFLATDAGKVFRD
jgi:hypothetical protein